MFDFDRNKLQQYILRQFDEEAFDMWITGIIYNIGIWYGKEDKGRSHNCPSLENASRDISFSLYMIRNGNICIELRNQHFGFTCHSYEISIDRKSDADDVLYIAEALTARLRNVLHHAVAEKELRKGCSKSFSDGCSGHLVAVPIGREMCLMCEELFLKYGDTGVPDKRGYVYFAGNIKTGIFKIGCSVNPQKRLVSAQKQVPFSVDIIHTVQTNQKYISELFIHSYFVFERLNGEWFHLSDEQLAVIRNVQSIQHNGKMATVTYFDNECISKTLKGNSHEGFSFSFSEQ